ncbi:ATP-binding protein [Streptomyces cyslabdanicus]|uniref:ATP-binding protein n=1 Tax=Streptomyces cyslabdanicus TaxID=1470456 RepID=UPI0040449583
MARSPAPASYQRPGGLVWPVALAAAAACAAAVSLIVGGTRTEWAATGGAAVLVLLAIVEWARRRHRDAMAENVRLRKEIQKREAQWRALSAKRSEALRAEIENLVTVQLPAMLSDEAVPPAHFGDKAEEEAAREVERVRAAVAEAAEENRERQETLRLAVVALARRVQAAAHRIQEGASLMAARHPGNADVLESSMAVDHSAAQQARLAQSLAVLCREWPGQQWQKPLALVDVVRAASGRITAFQRVEVAGDPDVAAAPQVVEPLIHLTAELLANATQSSPPRTTVSVTVRSVQRGAVVEIDDGGVGMDEHSLAKAREVASGRRPVGVGEVGEVPQTGLAVVGEYARRHGFGVDLLPSPYGGVRAVALVPAAMVEILDPAGTQLPEQRGPAAAPEPSRDPAPDTAEARDAAAGEGTAPSRLPQRRSPRGTPKADSPVAGPADASPALTPRQAADWMGAFFHGGQGADPTGDDTTGDAGDNVRNNTQE